MTLSQIDNLLISVVEKADKYVVRLVVANDFQGYQGELLISTLVDGAAMLETPFEEYKCESVKAITTDNGLPNFYYKFENNIFSWSKQVEGFNFKIYFGKIKMNPSDDVYRMLLCYNLVNNFLLH